MFQQVDARIDDKVTFTKYVSGLCSKSSKQLNVITRISKSHFYNSKKLGFDKFINSNFQYTSLVWHFVDMLAISQKIWETSLRILCQDHFSSYKTSYEMA